MVSLQKWVFSNAQVTVLQPLFSYSLKTVLWTRIRFILVSRIRIQVAKNLPKSWKLSTKTNQNHQNIIHFFLSKLINLCLTDMNIYPINNITDHFLKKYIFNRKSFKKSLYYLDFVSDLEQDPDPLFHETDPRCALWIYGKITWL